MDAVLAYDEAARPMEPAWLEADVIVGNPPFLGGNRIRQELSYAFAFSTVRFRIAMVKVIVATMMVGDTPSGGRTGWYQVPS